MFCRECGAKLEETVEICNKCGVPTPLYLQRQVHEKMDRENREMKWLIPMNCPFSAITAGYLGLLSVIPLLNLGAIIFGWWGLRTIAGNPGQEGAFRCWFGIVCGIISVIVYAGILVAHLLPRLTLP